MKGKVIIAGGTGFVGSYLTKRFREEGFQVLSVGRGASADVRIHDAAALNEALEGATLLVNLAGKPITTRFTEKNKQELISSRVHTTHLLGEALGRCKNRPGLWVNASGAHIYGTGDERPHTEHSPVDTGFFLAEMGAAWEAALFASDLPDVRKVALRISVVAGKDGGALQPFLTLARWGLGGTQGSGRQWFSWIHIEDIYRIIRFTMENEALSGPLNTTAPHPLRNAAFMKSVRKAVHMPLGIPAPALGIRIGAALMGIEADIILKSLYVIPQRLTEAGFQFRYPNIDEALAEITAK